MESLLETLFRAEMKSLGRDRVKAPVCCWPTGVRSSQDIRDSQGTFFLDSLTVRK